MEEQGTKKPEAFVSVKVLVKEDVLDVLRELYTRLHYEEMTWDEYLSNVFSLGVVGTNALVLAETNKRLANLPL